MIICQLTFPNLGDKMKKLILICFALAPLFSSAEEINVKYNASGKIVLPAGGKVDVVTGTVYDPLMSHNTATTRKVVCEEVKPLDQTGLTPILIPHRGEVKIGETTVVCDGMKQLFECKYKIIENSNRSFYEISAGTQTLGHTDINAGQLRQNLIYFSNEGKCRLNPDMDIFK
jgi:hypothetical protein